jgi:Cu-Zn family superoxide dismutase
MPAFGGTASASHPAQIERNRFVHGPFVFKRMRRGTMRRLALGVMSLLVISAGACAPVEQPLVPQGELATAGATASADIRNVVGQSKATATATQVGDSIRIRVDAQGMPRGTYAAHVHTTGSCAPPDFTSAGPHWNPTGQQHGRNNPAGMHKGDLPNLAVGTDGRGSFEFTIPSASVAGGNMALLDTDGAALVIHAQADDYRSDPSGNAGSRIACGVFR